METQEKFATCYNLPFTLCCDTKREAAKDFEIGKDFFGLVGSRITFVINKAGVIVEKYHGAIIMKAHVQAALKAVEKIEGRSASDLPTPLYVDNSNSTTLTEESSPSQSTSIDDGSV
eukprot:TRINITY_DN2570_c0_g1_i2.p1 TRINITY_DN2570_c0_g1~~TRINITY_DN2570_c0_g1_i2.p1  ORF type:complete len:117 (+),score=21.15 TRINITY_DN2570_c0_g1_i2:361-711(+)